LPHALFSIDTGIPQRHSPSATTGDDDELRSFNRRRASIRAGKVLDRHVSSRKRDAANILDGKSQIAAVAYEPNNAMPWRGTKMCRGMPSAQKRFLAMDHALAFVCAA
jgi:hypothetical protein